MEKKKFAESIIIRVGGGIREVYREQGDIPDVIDSYNAEQKTDKQEEVPVLRAETDSVLTDLGG